MTDPLSPDAEGSALSPSDRIERRIALTLGGLMTLGASIILVSAVSAAHSVRVASLLLIITCGACGSLLVVRGKRKAGYLVLIWGAWLGSVGGLFSGGGSTAPVSIVFPILIVFAAWVGGWAVVALGLATAVAFTVVDVALVNGLLPVRYAFSPYQALLVQLVIVGFSSALSFFAARSLRLHIDGLNESRALLSSKVAELGRAQSDLQHLNASLEQVVVQRTADLSDMVAGLESFNRSVSHDLRGSLGGIAGVARLAERALQQGDDSMVRRALPLIAEQAERSTRMMASLLSLAQVGEATMQRRQVSLRDLVHEVLAQLEAECAGQALPQIVVDSLPAVSADPDLLQRVFANLIGNAIKFSRAGRSTPRIEIGCVKAGDQVKVYVRDNGAGFDAEAAKQMFAPFRRLHGAQFEGHGVGLSIVRRAVERHGGRVWAEGRVGQGATFWFSLPA
jgi:signal transduction histidine kinase